MDFFLQKLGEKNIGSNEGQFALARGTCVIRDRLYVSDLNNSRIQVFGLNRKMEKNEIET